MGIYDELDKEVLTTKPQSTSIKNNNNSGGLFDELDNEVLSQQHQYDFVPAGGNG